MIEYFDSHTHLQFATYNKAREDLIEKTLQGGVGFVNVGTNKKTSEEAVELALKYKDQPVYAAVGLHPIHTYSKEGESRQSRGRANAGASSAYESGFYDENESMSGEEVEEFDYEFYKNLAADKKVVAIGECGLDYFRIKNDELGIKEKQIEAFKKQIKLASEVKKPLMIHCRNAYKNLLSVIYDFKSTLPETPGIIHFFAGTKEDAEKFLELGFYFTFGGVVTLTHDYDEVVKLIPKDRILLETDAPYVTPKTNRGKVNEPLFIKETYERVSELREVSLNSFKNQILKNNERIFGINL